MELIGTLLFSVVAGFSSLFPATPSDIQKNAFVHSEEELHKVLYIIDGDTFKVSRDGKPESVRLIGVDTPETVDPDEPVGCFGAEARSKTVELVGGQEVRLEQDSTQDTRDKYGRILAYAFLPDGTNVNKSLIEGGYGYEYTYLTSYKYQAEFKQAEKEAKEHKRGLWADGVCENFTPFVVPPLRHTSVFTCFYNAYNCVSFGSRAEAQKVYEACGGVTNDVHWLDGDKDGRACELWP